MKHFRYIDGTGREVTYCQDCDEYDYGDQCSCAAGGQG